MLYSKLEYAYGKGVEKRGEMKFYSLLASIALAVVTANVNSACIFMIHQPKLPEGAKKLRKF